MQRTGPTHIRTRALVVSLEKHGKATKEAAYRVLADALSMPTRTRAEVSLEKISSLNAVNAGKIFVVAGTILSRGKIEQPLHVAALRYSGKAREKVEAAKGKAYLLEDLITGKVPAKNLVLVK